MEEYGITGSGYITKGAMAGFSERKAYAEMMARLEQSKREENLRNTKKTGLGTKLFEPITNKPFPFD